jgi:hypothetical protein
LLIIYLSDESDIVHHRQLALQLGNRRSTAVPQAEPA